MAAITELRERLRASIVAGDSVSYVACFTEDAVLMHPDSPQIRGREGIDFYIRKIFEHVRVPMLELTPVTVVLSDDMAYEVGTQQCEMEPVQSGFNRDRQHLHVYRRGNDGGWRIAAAMSGNQ
jgi:uncharacterized protein (TIGR02246 family)